MKVQESFLVTYIYINFSCTLYVSKLKIVNILHHFYYKVLACAPKMNERHLTPFEISSNCV